MNLHHTTLGVFVPGKWTVPQNPITGGMGEFVPGHFAVPQNDIVGAGLAGLSEFVPAHFTVPQNPITGLAGLGCGCGGGCRKGMSGISDDLSGAFDSVSSTLNGALGGISSTTLMWAAAGVAALFMLTSRGGSASSYRSARSQALAKVRAQYPTVAGRARRAVAAF